MKPNAPRIIIALLVTSLLANGVLIWKWRATKALEVEAANQAWGWMDRFYGLEKTRDELADKIEIEKAHTSKAELLAAATQYRLERVVEVSKRALSEAQQNFDYIDLLEAKLRDSEKRVDLRKQNEERLQRMKLERLERAKEIERLQPTISYQVQYTVEGHVEDVDLWYEGKNGSVRERVSLLGGWSKSFEAQSGDYLSLSGTLPSNFASPVTMTIRLNGEVASSATISKAYEHGGVNLRLK